MSYSPLPIQQTNVADAIDLVLSGAVGAQAVVVAETAAARTNAMMDLSRDALAVAGAVVELAHASVSGVGTAIEITAAPTLFDGTQSAQTGGSPTALLITGGAHTTLAASTEASFVDFNSRQTVEFAAGNFALQRNVQIQQPTYAADGASTIARAATLGVEAGPGVGANMTYGVTGDEGESLSIYAEGRYLGLFDTGAANSTDHGMRLETDGGTLGTSKSDSPMSIWSAGAINPSDAGGAPRRLGFGVGTRATAGNPTTADLHWYFQKASALLEAGWGTEIMTLSQTGDLSMTTADLTNSGSGNSLDIAHSGAADAINIALATDVASQALVATEDAVARTAPMIEITRDAAAVAAGAQVIDINNNGGGNCVNIVQAGPRDALGIALSTDVLAQALVVTEDAVARSTAVIQITRNATATGRSFLIDHNGAGIALDFDYGGASDAINVALDGSSTAAQALVVTETAVARTTPMIDLTRDAAASGAVIEINNAGSGYGIDVLSGQVRIQTAVALGGGAGATLGTIGGTGPAAAGQNEWMRIDTQNGTRWVAVWA
jgi:hypothetical protein